MKKLFALLMSCMLMTSAFVSCKSSDGSSSGESAANTTAADTTDSSGVTSEESTENEDSTETEATTAAQKTTIGAKTTSADKTTAAVSTEPTHEPEIDPDTLKGGDITGTWSFVDEGEETTMVFNADNSIDMIMDMSEMISFQNGSLIFDENYDNAMDYTFDGKKLSVIVDGESILEMERVSDGTSASDLNGDYRITGGMIQTLIGNMDSRMSGSVYTINGKKTTLRWEGAFSYKTSGNQLTMIKKNETEDFTGNYTYGVDGDTLTIIDETGDSTTLERK